MFFVKKIFLLFIIFLFSKNLTAQENLFDNNLDNNSQSNYLKYEDEILIKSFSTGKYLYPSPDKPSWWAGEGDDNQAPRDPAYIIFWFHGGGFVGYDYRTAFAGRGEWSKWVIKPWDNNHVKTGLPINFGDVVSIWSKKDSLPDAGRLRFGMKNLVVVTCFNGGRPGDIRTKFLILNPDNLKDRGPIEYGQKVFFQSPNNNEKFYFSVGDNQGKIGYELNDNYIFSFEPYKSFILDEATIEEMEKEEALNWVKSNIALLKNFEKDDISKTSINAGVFEIYSNISDKLNKVNQKLRADFKKAFIAVLIRLENIEKEIDQAFFERLLNNEYNLFNESEIKNLKQSFSDAKKILKEINKLDQDSDQAKFEKIYSNMLTTLEDFQIRWVKDKFFEKLNLAFKNLSPKYIQTLIDDEKKAEYKLWFTSNQINELNKKVKVRNIAK